MLGTFYFLSVPRFPVDIAPTVVGGLCCVGFVAWERYGAVHPLIPFRLLTDRTVIAAFVIAVFHPVAGRIAGYASLLRPCLYEPY